MSIEPLSKHSPEQTLAGKRILIVEDEGVTVMQLCRAFKRVGIEVAGVASNGEEGVELALRDKPDIILMDVNMPVMNGIEAVRRIVAVYSPCIVMLTAYDGAEYLQEAWDAGAHGYVVKPVTSETFLPIIARVYEARCVPNPG